MGLLVLQPTATQEEDNTTNFNTATLEQNNTNTMKPSDAKEEKDTTNVNTTAVGQDDNDTLNPGKPKARRVSLQSKTLRQI